MDSESDDSFFDDPSITKKPRQTKTLEDIFGTFEDDQKVEKSGQSSMDNVPSSPVAKPRVRFNVEETKSVETIEQNTGTSKSSLASNKGLDWLGTTDDLDIPKKELPPPKTTQKSDLLDDILSTTPSKAESKKSFDLLDDILPQRGQKSDQKKTTSFEDILKESRVQKSGPSSIEKSTLGGGEPKSGPGSLEDILKVGRGQKGTKDSSDGLSLILEPPKGGGLRRGRRTSGVADVLGLFGSGPSSGEFGGEPKGSNVGEKRSTSAEKSQDIPDWLGGSSTTINKSDTTISSQKSEIKSKDGGISQPETKTVRVPTPTKSIPTTAEENIESHVEISSQKSPQNILQNTNLSAENFQTSMSNLQTQESFLLVSLQLKKYEENLTDIKKQQEEILKKQENQFDRFLNTYIEKQKSIEHEMLSQQERINDHIRMLAITNLDGVKHYAKLESNQKNLNDGADITGENNNPDEFRNTILEKIVKELKQRHYEEYFLMEEAYKKQISLMEKSSEQLEQRLHQEIENISKLYEEKLQNMKAQHTEEIKYWTEKIKNIEEMHKEDMESVKEKHARTITEIKNDFLEEIERFKERNNRDSDLLSNTTEISQKLNFSMDKLEKNEQTLENLQEKVVNDYNILSIARERSIENKEKEISMMRGALEKCREQAEKERSQLLALVRTLEQKISEQSQNSQEERWALQQAAATIAARSVAFDREVEFSRASIEREREQLKTLKETLLAEQEKVTLHLTEEKLKLSAEKSRLDVSAKLVNNYEVEKIKTEAETAIQVAKELTDKLNLERNFVQRQKIELENYRSKLVEKERGLLEREEYMEEMKRSMQQKINEDRRVIQEAKFMENRYKEKLQELQSQATLLSNREKKLAEEKLTVSKERLALYTSMKSQSRHKKCMLCRAEEDNITKSEVLFLGHPEVDPEFMRLRIEAIEDDRNSEVSREDNSNSLKLKQSHEVN